MAEELTIEEHYQRIALEINLIRSARVAAKPLTPNDMEKIRLWRIANPTHSVEYVVENAQEFDLALEGGGKAQAKRRARSATVDEIKQWVKDTVAEVKRDLTARNIPVTPEIEDDIRDRIAENLFTVTREYSEDTDLPVQFESQFDEGTKAWEQAALIASDTQTRYAKQLPGSLTYLDRQKEILNGFAAEGLITPEQEMAYSGDRSSDYTIASNPELYEQAVAFNTQMRLNMPEFMAQASVGLSTSATAPTTNLSTVTSRYVNSVPEDQISTLAIPEIVIPVTEPDTIDTGLARLQRQLEPDENGDFSKNQIEDAVTEAFGEPDRDDFLLGEQGQAEFDAAVKALETLIDDTKDKAKEYRELRADGDPVALGNDLAAWLRSETTNPAAIRSRQVAASSRITAEAEAKATSDRILDQETLQGSTSNQIAAAQEAYQDLTGRPKSELSPTQALAFGREIAFSDTPPTLEDAERFFQASEDERAAVTAEGTADKLAVTLSNENSRRQYVRNQLRGNGIDPDSLSDEVLDKVDEWFREGGTLDDDDLAYLREQVVGEEQRLANIEAISDEGIARTARNLGITRLGSDVDDPFEKRFRDVTTPRLQETLQAYVDANPTANFDFDAITARILDLRLGPEEQMGALPTVTVTTQPPGTFEAAEGLTQSTGVQVDPVAAAQISEEYAEPDPNFDFKSRAELQRELEQQNEFDTPGLTPRVNQALIATGRAPLPTLGTVGQISQSELEASKQDILGQDDLGRLILELSGGDPFLQQFLLEQVQSEEFQGTFNQFAREDQLKQEAELFRRFAFTQEGGVETAPLEGTGLNFGGNRPSTTSQEAYIRSQSGVLKERFGRDPSTIQRVQNEQERERLKLEQEEEREEEMLSQNMLRPGRSTFSEFAL